MPRKNHCGVCGKTRAQTKQQPGAWAVDPDVAPNALRVWQNMVWCCGPCYKAASETCLKDLEEVARLAGLNDNTPAYERDATLTEMVRLARERRAQEYAASAKCVSWLLPCAICERLPLTGGTRPIEGALAPGTRLDLSVPYVCDACWNVAVTVAYDENAPLQSAIEETRKVLREMVKLKREGTNLCTAGK